VDLDLEDDSELCDTLDENSMERVFQGHAALSISLPHVTTVSSLRNGNKRVMISGSLRESPNAR
jgi:hypothetical protein